MRDFYPEDMAVRNAIFDAWKKSSHLFGFSEYDSCVVETLALLKRKKGEEIVDQIYDFTDKSGRELVLRPEMTPTLARMIAARHSSFSFPLKWFTIAQCFRYERMSLGRKREHYQWNLDIVGEDSVTAEAEIVAAAVHALSTLGLNKDDFYVHFSSRALLADLLLKLGIAREHHAPVFLAFDKRGKICNDDIDKILREAGLDQKNIRQAFSLLNISSLEQAAEFLGNNQSSYRDVLQFLEILDAYGIRDRLKFDISVVRGLAYYTGIVFEAFDANRKFRAIFGGGRYDNLLKEIGGKTATGVGLGFGDVVITEILGHMQKAGSHDTKAETAVGYMHDDQRATAISIATALRNGGNTTDLALCPEKAKNFFSRVGKSGFREAIYVGPDDVASKTVRIKNLATRSEREVVIKEMTTSSVPVIYPQ